MIDDATSRLFARFVPHDTTEENMKLLKSYLEFWSTAGVLDRQGEYFSSGGEAQAG